MEQNLQSNNSEIWVKPFPKRAGEISCSRNKMKTILCHGIVWISSLSTLLGTVFMLLHGIVQSLNAGQLCSPWNNTDIGSEPQLMFLLISWHPAGWFEYFWNCKILLSQQLKSEAAVCPRLTSTGQWQTMREKLNVTLTFSHPFKTTIYHLLMATSRMIMIINLWPW